MQRLSAPTRGEVDYAHKRHHWVDIGVPSVRNLGLINPWRMWGWLLLAASSLPLHLVYNSAVFTQISPTDYSVAIVDPSFISGAPFEAATVNTTMTLIHDVNYDTAALLWLQSHLDILTNLSVIDCIDAYAQQTQTERGNVLAVTLPITTFVINTSVYGMYDYKPAAS